VFSAPAWEPWDPGSVHFLERNIFSTVPVKDGGVCHRLAPALAEKGFWKTFLAFSLIVLQVLLQAFPVAHAQSTSVERDIVSDTVWTRAGSPYIILKSITVADGVTLKVEPGTVVEVLDDVVFTVRGKLAVGGKGDPVKVSGVGVKLNWNLTCFGDAVLENTVVQNVRSVSFTRKFSASNVLFNSSRIHVYAGEGSEATFSNVTAGEMVFGGVSGAKLSFSSLKCKLLSIEGDRFGLYGSRLTIEKSEVGGLNVRGKVGVAFSEVKVAGSRIGDMSLGGRESWESPFLYCNILNSTVAVEDSDVGTVSFSGSRRGEVYSTFWMRGVENSTVAFNNVRAGDVVVDRSVGGSRILFNSLVASTVVFSETQVVNSQLKFENSTMLKVKVLGTRYGDHVMVNSTLDIRASTLSELQIMTLGAFWLYNTGLVNSIARIEGSTVAHGAGVNISLYGLFNSKFVVSNSNVYGNSPYGFRGKQVTQFWTKDLVLSNSIIDLSGNWWGDASGPHHTILNPSGAGDRVDGNVTISSWLKSPVGGTPPKVSIEVARPIAVEGSPIAFKVKSSEPATLSYFTFGDGGFLGWTTSSEAVHVYGKTGEYTATVLVKGKQTLLGKATVSIRVVTVPNVKISYPANGTIVGGRQVTVEYSVKDNYMITEIRVLVDNMTVEAFKPNMTSFNMMKSRVENVSDGFHWITVKAANVFGVSSEASVSVRVDATPPELAVECPSKAYGGTFEIRWNASDTVSGVDPYSLVIRVGWMTFTPNKVAGNMTFKISSNLNVTVSVSDRAGNTVSKTFSVEYVPIPSSTTSSSTGTGTPATGTESYTETFTETYSPPESSAVEIVPYIGLAIIVAAAVLAAIIALKRRREKVLVQPEAQQPPPDLGQVVSA
jgi:hypothetical protein